MIKFNSAEWTRSRMIDYRNPLEREIMAIKKAMTDACNDNRGFIDWTIWNTNDEFRDIVKKIDILLKEEGYEVSWEPVKSKPMSGVVGHIAW